VPVSLPLVPQLLDGKRYMKPSDVPRLEGTEQRRYRHRGPTLRSLIKLALACDSAEQLGQALKRRYDRAHPPSRRDQRELERLDRLLAD